MSKASHENNCLIRHKIYYHVQRYATLLETFLCDFYFFLKNLTTYEAETFTRYIHFHSLIWNYFHGPKLDLKEVSNPLLRAETLTALICLVTLLLKMPLFLGLYSNRVSNGLDYIYIYILLFFFLYLFF